MSDPLLRLYLWTAVVCYHVCDNALISREERQSINVPRHSKPLNCDPAPPSDTSHQEVLLSGPDDSCILQLKVRVDFGTCKRKCEDHWSGHMLSLHTYMQNAFFTDKSYLDLTLTHQIGFWLGLKRIIVNDSLTFEWLDGTPYDATFFSLAQPSNFAECFILGKSEYPIPRLAESGIWISTSCSAFQYCLCMKQPLKRPEDSAESDFERVCLCILCWTKGGFKKAENRKSFDDANVECNKLNGMLTELGNINEGKLFAKGLSDKVPYAYIGLYADEPESLRFLNFMASEPGTNGLFKGLKRTYHDCINTRTKNKISIDSLDGYIDKAHCGGIDKDGKIVLLSKSECEVERPYVCNSYGYEGNRKESNAPDLSKLRSEYCKNSADTRIWNTCARYGDLGKQEAYTTDEATTRKQGEIDYSDDYGRDEDTY